MFFLDDTDLLFEEDIFEQFFASDNKTFFHTYKKDGNVFAFHRQEDPKRFKVINQDDFVSFETAMGEFSIWGFSVVTFKFYLNGKLMLHYELDPKKIILPILMKSMQDQDIKVHANIMILKRSAVQYLIAKIQGHLIHMLRSEIEGYMEECKTESI